MLQSEGGGPAVPGLSADDVRAAITKAHHEEWSRVVAALTGRFGDLDLAEESAAEAFAAAVVRWPDDGVPPNPGGWLTTTATRKAIDRIRREHTRHDKERKAEMLHELASSEPHAVDDDRLRLIFTCCHPALAREAQVALTLRMVGGLTVRRSPEACSRAKPRSASGSPVRKRRSPTRISHTACRRRGPPQPPGAVLSVLYLVFNEGYLPGGERELRPETQRRGDTADEASVRAHARRGRGGRTVGTAADDRSPAREQDQLRWRVGGAHRPGSRWLGPRADRRRTRARARADRRWHSSWPLPAAGGDQRRAHLRRGHPGYGLGTDRARCTTSSMRSIRHRSSH